MHHDRQAERVVCGQQGHGAIQRKALRKVKRRASFFRIRPGVD
jgi:hypothetical protein